MLSFEDLIEDVLLHVFSYLDPADLFSIQCLNVDKLSSVVQQSLKRCSGTMLITGHDCFPGLDPIECNDDRLRIHYNWLKGHFQPRSMFEDQKLKHIGRMCMDQKQFYLADKGEVRRYERLPNGLAGDQFEGFGDVDNEDPVISTMTLNEDHLFTGTYYGTCSYIRNGVQLINNHKIHDSYKDVLAMDYNYTTQTLASSNFREVKLFRVDGDTITTVGEADWRARCLKIDATSDHLVVGNVCTDFHNADGFITRLTALSLYDMATLQKKDLRCTSAGIVDLAWHSSPQVILTGHWSGDLRLFDLRSDSDEVAIKKEGVEDVNVSLQYDGNHGVVCGFRKSTEVCLYDLRQTKGPVRSYGEFKSPELTAYLVNILVDHRRLFVVNFEEVRMYDFDQERE